MVKKSLIKNKSQAPVESVRGIQKRLWALIKDMTIVKWYKTQMPQLPQTIRVDLICLLMAHTTIVDQTYPLWGEIAMNKAKILMGATSCPAKVRSII